MVLTPLRRRIRRRPAKWLRDDMMYESGYRIPRVYRIPMVGCVGPGYTLAASDDGASLSAFSSLLAYAFFIIHDIVKNGDR